MFQFLFLIGGLVAEQRVTCGQESRFIKVAVFLKNQNYNTLIPMHGRNQRIFSVNSLSGQ